MDDFDPEELHRLVDDALAPASRAPVDGAPGLVTFGDLVALEVLDRVLPQYVDQADLAAITGAIREELISTIRVPRIEAVHDTVKRCRKCSTATAGATLPLGNKADPDVVFVVEKLPIPFVEEFTALLKVAGFSSNRVAVTSAVRCPMAEVTDTELGHCSRYLYDEITIWKPTLIMPLGNAAIKTILSDTSATVTHERGALKWVGPWAILPSWAPGSVARSSSRKDELVSDLTAGFRFCYGEMDIR